MEVNTDRPPFTTSSFDHKGDDHVIDFRRIDFSIWVHDRTLPFCVDGHHIGRYLLNRENLLRRNAGVAERAIVLMEESERLLDGDSPVNDSSEAVYRDGVLGMERPKCLGIVICPGFIPSRDELSCAFHVWLRRGGGRRRIG